MTWTATEGSHVFRAWVVDCMLKGSATGYTGLDSDSVKCALYGNVGTPDRNVAVASTGRAKSSARALLRRDANGYVRTAERSNSS